MLMSVASWISYLGREDAVLFPLSSQRWLRAKRYFATMG